MEIMNGKNSQKIFLNQLKKEFQLFNFEKEIIIIVTGENKVETSYLKAIEKMKEEIGYKIKIMHYIYISEKNLLKVIDKLNYDEKVSGIMVLYPLIDNLDEKEIKNHIHPKKDIEGLNEISILKKTYLPCTALGIIMFLEEKKVNIQGKNIVLLNRSPRIGLPLFSYFSNHGADVTIMHANSKNQTLLENADIIISAIGKPHQIKSTIFKENAIVIDAGMSLLNGKIVGDIQIKEPNLMKYYLPPIHGVGPYTIMALASNIYTSYFYSSSLK